MQQLEERINNQILGGKAFLCQWECRGLQGEYRRFSTDNVFSASSLAIFSLLIRLQSFCQRRNARPAALLMKACSKSRNDVIIDEL